MTSLTPKKQSFTELAYQELKRQVLNNELAPGNQYLEQELAEQLSMSRTPVHEALQKMANDGLVEIIPRRGVRILPLSGSDMADIYMILTGLEAAAAEQAASQGLSEVQLKAMQQALEEMDKALRKNDLVAWAQADERFHKSLVETTANQRLISMVQMLWDQAHRARLITLKLRPKPVQSNNDQRALIDAIVARDPGRAWKIHSDHRKNSAAMLVRLLDDLGLKQL